MDLTIEYLEEDGIVFAKVAGIMDFAEHKRFVEEMSAIRKKYNSRKIFVDMMDMTPHLTVLEIDDMPKTLIEYGAKPEHKIAALHDPPPPYDKGFAFFKNSAALRSLQIKQFTNKDEAYAWLKSEP